MKTLLVARKSLIEIFREPQLLILTLLLPLIFLGITAFSYGEPLLATHPLLIYSEDDSEAGLVADITAQRYADGRPVFDINLVENLEEAEYTLATHDATALVMISMDGTGDTAVTIEGDALYGPFYRASSILDGVIARYGDRTTERRPVVQVEAIPLAEGGPQTDFDVYAPGMMIFAWLMIIPQTAMLVARERRWRTLHRLRLTRLNTWELLAGIGLAQMVVAVLQVIVVFAAALALGFNSQGSLLLAVIIGCLICLSAIGLGLIVAAFAENDSQAANIGSTITMLQVFLSGAFYEMPPLTIFTVGGHPIGLFDVFPATHGLLALQQVFNYGASLSQVAFRLGATLILSVIILVAGVAIYHRQQMRSRA
jgi:ABC-2 type transport system permease protein